MRYSFGPSTPTMVADKMPVAYVGENARGCACEDTNWRTDLESLARSGVRLEEFRREGGVGWGGKRRNDDLEAHRRRDRR
jgi:hypothetical protein